MDKYYAMLFGTKFIDFAKVQLFIHNIKFYTKKPDSIKVGLYKGVVSKDAMKLRKTGFESLRPFVIHRAKHTSKGVARHWNEKLVSAFHNF